MASPDTTGSTLALALSEPAPGPVTGLTPAQIQLRQMVVDSVQAPTSKLAYGQALDALFAFAATRPLTRALLQAWRSSMEHLAPSTINVRLSAVRKLIAEAQANGMLSGEDAETPCLSVKSRVLTYCSAAL